VDCDKGRAMGCHTFCCRLIVRLAPGELEPSGEYADGKRCVDKDPTSGWCIHLDCQTSRCRVWAQRPVVCREYDCNHDPLLPIVLSTGIVNLAQLVRAPRSPCDTRPIVPYRRGEP
jgi:hypothetical protein